MNITGDCYLVTSYPEVEPQNKRSPTLARSPLGGHHRDLLQARFRPIDRSRSSMATKAFVGIPVPFSSLIRRHSFVSVVRVTITVFPSDTFRDWCSSETRCP